jgi:hypothetical protein
MRLRQPDPTVTAVYAPYETGPESSYQRRTLRAARHRLDLIAGLMLVLAGVLAGWSVHQAHSWRRHAIAVVTDLREQAVVVPAAPSDRSQAQSEHRIRAESMAVESPANHGALGGFAGPSWPAPAAVVAQPFHSLLPALEQARLDTTTSGDYVLTAGIFLLAALCCAGSLRRASAAAQMTALMAAELFTLVGVGLLGTLPVAL